MLKADKRCLRKEDKLEIQKILKRLDKMAQKIYDFSDSADKVYSKMSENIDGLFDLKMCFRHIRCCASLMLVKTVGQSTRKLFGGSRYSTNKK